MKHTQGEWVARESYGKPGRFEIRPAEHKVKGSTIGFSPLAYVQGDKRVTGGDGSANAKLMAAAPELLIALKEIAEGTDDPQRIAIKLLKKLNF